MMKTARRVAPSAPVRWQPRLRAADYERSFELTILEQRAIRAFLERRSAGATYAWSRGERPKEPSLHRLLRPLLDALDIIDCEHSDYGNAIAILLRACLQASSTFWAWNHDQWIGLLGRTSRAFRAGSRPYGEHAARLHVAAIAYLHGWFRDVLALGAFKRVALARRVFGAQAIETACRVVTGPLARWGYAVGKGALCCLCEALLLNESPHLEALSAETLNRLRRSASVNRRAYYYQLAKALVIEGVLDAPLPIASGVPPVTVGGPSDHVSPEWCDWIARWACTSTLESRGHLRLHMYKAGRWLARQHPGIVSPAQWDRELAAEYVAAVARMRVGDFTMCRPTSRPFGEPLSPRSKSTALAALRIFFWDCQEWGWIERRFDPGRSLALPRSIKALIGPKPRVIADDVWARLLWAGLHLVAADLPRSGVKRGPRNNYPLKYVRAVALVWLFAGLRSDEISRLRVGCVRWQPVEGGDATKPVCLLDIPANKTASDFAKPVDPKVGEAIEDWEAVRPEQPKQTDRKTRERTHLLFTYRARPMHSQFINGSLIPTLCAKAGVPTRDVRGTITSHRARATIASQLFNSREPMSLFELQAWLGHGSPASTQHYVAITPTKLAKAYSDAGYFERNVRAIRVLVDQDVMKQGIAEGEPWRFYDLGHGLCAYEFFDQCAHRLACARCDFYRPRDSTVAQILAAKDNILRFLQEIPLTDDERAAVEGDVAAIDHLTRKLADHPTPSGQTPAELTRGAPAASRSRGLTSDST